MEMALLEKIPNTSAAVILSLAVILFAGFLLTRITKRCRLPDVTAYILAGVIIGPYMLHLVPESMIIGMGFVTDIALAYIAFDVGKYFKLAQLRRNRGRIVMITLLESLITAVAITLTMYYVFCLSLSFSLLLGAISSATAPASTIMTIRQYRAKGEMVDTILQVVALDNAVALTAFSICGAVVKTAESGAQMDWIHIVLPLFCNGLVIAFGAGCGFLLKWIITDSRSREHRLILINGVIFLLTGCCSLLNVSPLLSCMAMGAVYANIIGNKNLFKQVNHFTPPILLMFFVISGMRLNVSMLKAAGVIGVVYFLVRIIGKYAGSYLGAFLCKAPLEIRHYLGLALVPQAGVSIGLAALAQRILPEDLGAMLSTIILSSGILYEIVGPVCAKTALQLSRSIVPPEKKSEIKQTNKSNDKDV